MADLGIFSSTNPSLEDIQYVNRLNTPSNLRALSHKDISEVAALLSRCFYPQTGWLSWFTPLMQMGIFHDLQSRYSVRRIPYSNLIGAQVIQKQNSRELIGTVEVSLKSLSPWLPFSPAVPYISNLAVSPDHRQQGIGQQLLVACEEMAHHWEFNRLYLHVLDNNTPARRLYAKAGYHRIESPPQWSSLLLAQPRRLLLCKSL